MHSLNMVARMLRRRPQFSSESSRSSIEDCAVKEIAGYSVAELESSGVTTQSHTTEAASTAVQTTECLFDVDNYGRLAAHFEQSQLEVRILREQVKTLQVKLASSENALAAANNRATLMDGNLQTMNKTIESYRRQLEGQRKHNAQVEAVSKKGKATVTQLNTQVANLNKEKHRLTSSIEGARREKVNLEMKLAAQRNEKLGDIAKMSDLLADANFEIGRLNYLARDPESYAIEVDSVEPKAMSSRPEHRRDALEKPYVALLVDGDAYRWAPCLFRNSGQDHKPGVVAANEIYNAILDNIARLHPELTAYKIIARIFINEQGVASRKALSTFKQFNHDPAIFRHDFTESFAMFDYLDAGKGKERVDYKIHENFKHFITDSRCHHVFLAVCTDNSFARQLEPFRYKEARERITLVSPGYSEWEISEMNFNTVTWPTIFMPRQMPELSRLKGVYRKRDQNQEVARAALHNKELGLNGRIDKMAASLVQSIVPGHELWEERIEEGVRRWSERMRGFGVPGGMGLPVFANEEAQAVD